MDFSYGNVQGLQLLRINPRVSKTTHTGKETIKSKPTVRDHGQPGPTASLLKQSNISERPLPLERPANQGGNRKPAHKAQTAQHNCP